MEHKVQLRNLIVNIYLFIWFSKRVTSNQDINCKVNNGFRYFHNTEASTWIRCISGCPGYVSCESCCNQDLTTDESRAKAEHLKDESKLNVIIEDVLCNL